MSDEGKYPVPENLPEGATIVYPEKGGMLIRLNGHNAKGSILPSQISTSEEGRRRKQMGVEATKRKTRQEIVEVAKIKFAKMRETGELKSVRNVEHASDVFAVAAGMMFDDIVLNKKAYPRDRLAAFKDLGKLTEVLEDETKPPDNNPLPQSMLDGASRILIAIEYAKEHPEEFSPSRDAEVIDIVPKSLEPKKWI
jgi:hypothetical protein